MSQCHPHRREEAETKTKAFLSHDNVAKPSGIDVDSTQAALLSICLVFQSFAQRANTAPNLSIDAQHAKGGDSRKRQENTNFASSLLCFPLSLIVTVSHARSFGLVISFSHSNPLVCWPSLASRVPPSNSGPGPDLLSCSSLLAKYTLKFMKIDKLNAKAPEPQL